MSMHRKIYIGYSSWCNNPENVIHRRSRIFITLLIFCFFQFYDSHKDVIVACGKEVKILFYKLDIVEIGCSC